MRAQLHLRQMLVYSDAPCMHQPEVLIPRAQERFDAQGVLTDESTRAAPRPVRSGVRRPRPALSVLARSESATGTSRGSRRPRSPSAAGGRVQRQERVEHDRELVGARRADRLLVARRGAARAGRPSGDARCCPGPTPLARREVAVAVEDDLVAVRRAVRVRARDRLGVEVDRARHEAADQRAARGERAVPRRRQVHRARRAAGTRGSGTPTDRPCRPSRRRRAASPRA